jgi:protein-arginine kinase activator protein McsA
MSNRICKNCKGKEFTLLASEIQGLNKVIDIYICRNCKNALTVVTEKNQVEEDFDEDFHDVVFDKNPYDDNDGGWDPSIG